MARDNTKCNTRNCHNERCHGVRFPFKLLKKCEKHDKGRYKNNAHMMLRMWFAYLESGRVCPDEFYDAMKELQAALSSYLKQANELV
jgi:hypothetical protein